MNQRSWGDIFDITLHGMHLHSGRLRATMEELPEIRGTNVEVLDGTVVLTPARSGQHSLLVRDINQAIDPQLGGASNAGVGGYQRVAVESDDPADEDHAIPDLTFCDLLGDGTGGDSWLVPASRVTMVCEVISPGRAALIDIALKPRLYARWGVPLYLIVDPREATVTLRSQPDDGHYRTTLQRAFTDLVTFPAPLAGVQLRLAGDPETDDRGIR